MKQLSTKDDEVKRKLLEYRQMAEEGNQAAFARMSICERYKLGDQWSQVDRSRNKDLGKHNITINQILPTVNQLVGDEVQNPRDPQVYPLRGATETRARLLSALIKYSLDAQQAARKTSAMFEDGVSTGRGYLSLDRDYTLDQENGNLAVKHWNPFMILPDPACKAYDYNATGGARFVIADEWTDKDMIHAQHPGLKHELENANYESNGLMDWVTGAWSSIMDWGRKTNPWEVPDDYHDTCIGEAAHGVYKAKHNYKVSQYYVKTWKKGAHIIYPETGQMRIVHDQAGVDREKERANKGRMTVQILQQDRWGRPIAVPVLTRYSMVGNVMLSAIEDPFDGVMDLPFFRFSPYFSHGYEMSLVQNLIGAQDALNWSRSMVMNIVKRLTYSLLKVGRGTPKQIAELQANLYTDNYVINESDFGNVEKIDQASYPANFEQVGNMSFEDMTRISGVRREDPTFDAKNQSGKAIQAKQAAAQTGTAPQLMRFDWTRENINRQAIEHIIQGDIFTPDEIRMVVDKSDLLDPAMLDQARQTIMVTTGLEGIEEPQRPAPEEIVDLDPGMQLKMEQDFQAERRVYNQVMDTIDQLAEPIAIDGLIDEVQNLSQGQYGIKVALSQAAITYKQTAMLDTMAVNEALIASGHQPLSRESIIKASDLPNKEAELAAAG